MTKEETIEHERLLEKYKHFKYLHFWIKVLRKQKVHVEHNLFHYKNLKSTIWIVFFNPVMVFIYPVVILFILLISVSTR